jgi:bromodomain adjacent to zinc finger domain protein 1A
MLAEIHSCLIYNLRTVNFQRHSAVLSLVRHRDAMMAVDEVDVDDSGATKDRDGFGVSVDDLIATMGDVGNNWERVPLRHAEGRLGWEEAMFGCIKDVRDLLRNIHAFVHHAIARRLGEVPSPSTGPHAASVRP